MSRWWIEQPRRFTIGVSILLVAIAFLPPWSDLPLRPFTGAKVNSLIGVATAAWAGEAALFAFTATVTAVVLAALTDPTERQRLLILYRARAFDAMALLTAVVVILTGICLIQILGAEARGSDPNLWFVKLCLLFVLDIAGSAYLLIYTHHLVTTAAQERVPELLRRLGNSLREAVEREASGLELERWGQGRGLRVEGDALAYPPDAHPITLPKTAYVRDVKLRPLARWLRSLHGNLEGDTKAITGLRLNIVVLPGWPIGAVSQQDEQVRGGLLSVVKWKDRRPETDFASAITAVVDRAAAAAGDGRLADFEQELEALEAVYLETCRLRARVGHLQADLLTALVGWQPETIFRNRLRRLGLQVLRSPADFIVTRWLYFAQELATESRPHVGRDLDMIYTIWIQAARLPNQSGLWPSFWQRLQEYAANLNMWLAGSRTEQVLGPLFQEVQRLLVGVRWIVVVLSPHRFAPVPQLVDDLGSGLQRGSLAQGPFSTARAKLASELANLKRLFWLGYAAVMLRRMESAELSKEDALAQWKAVRSAFASMADVWEAWEHIERDDPFRWDWEEGREQLAAAEGRGRRVFVGSVDPRAGTTLPFVLLSLSLVDRWGLPSDADARGVLDQIQPVLDKVLADRATWEPFIT